MGYNTLLDWHEHTQALSLATGVSRAPILYIWGVQNQESCWQRTVMSLKICHQLPCWQWNPKLQCPLNTARRVFVPQVEPANLGWDLPGFNSKHAWLNSRFCPFLKLSFTQTSPSFPPVIRQVSELCLPGTQQGCAPPLAHKYPQHSDSLAPAPPDFVVRPLRMWETLLHFLSLLQKMQITSL